MGLASRFFYSADTENDTLYRKLLPSEERRSLQSGWWNALAEFLVDWFKQRGMHVTHWQQGSCKFGTQIRPLNKESSDVDLGLYAELKGQLPPAQIVKSLVQDALLEYASVTPEVVNVLAPPKERACRIELNDHFHIDVPIYYFNPATNEVKLATETKGWEPSDPGKMVDWFLKVAGAEDERTQLRRIIRYLKGLATLKFELSDRPSSTLLTVLATRAYQSAQGTFADDDLLVFIARNIVSSLKTNSFVKNPIDPNENLNRMSLETAKRFIDELNQIIIVGEYASRTSGDFQICTQWAEIFGPLFPVPDPTFETRNAGNLLALIQPEIDVIATPTKYKALFTGRNKIGPIPKECKITFKIVSNIPEGAIVEWTVRNKGDEAESEHDLGHHAGTGLTVTRPSAYNGSHSMDCAIKDLHGRLLGFRKVDVTIFDGTARNPRSKPGYRRIQGLRR